MLFGDDPFGGPDYDAKASQPRTIAGLSADIMASMRKDLTENTLPAGTVVRPDPRSVPPGPAAPGAVVIKPLGTVQQLPAPDQKWAQDNLRTQFNGLSAHIATGRAGTALQTQRPSLRNQQ